MIESSSTMDRPVATRRGISRKMFAIGGLALLPLVGGAFFLPSIVQWMGAERSFDLDRLRLGVVERGDLERDLAVQGRVVAAFHPTTFSPATGTVSLSVRAGEVVEQGQPLATVDGPELRNRLQQERSSLQSLLSDLERQRISARQTALADQQRIDLAEVELEAARRGMQRAERSRTELIINDVEFEQAQDAVRRAELELRHARQDGGLRGETLEFETRNSERQVERQQLVVSELERQVEELTIRSPVAGLVSRVDVEDHDAVTPGQALVTVVDLSAFEIEMQIPESYADEIGAGLAAEIGIGNERYPGTVKGISPEVEGSQVRGIVAFAAEPPEGLRQNQRVSVRLVLEQRSGILKVARGPFLEAGGGREVYVVSDDTATLQPIEVGATSVGEVEILSGLREGDRIVISDTARFEEAERVFLRK